MITFVATLQFEVELEVPDEFFIDEITGHPITASEYISEHIGEYREQITKANGRCIRAIATEEEEE